MDVYVTIFVQVFQLNIFRINFVSNIRDILMIVFKSRDSKGDNIDNVLFLALCTIVIFDFKMLKCCLHEPCFEVGLKYP